MLDQHVLYVPVGDILNIDLKNMDFQRNSWSQRMIFFNLRKFFPANFFFLWTKMINPRKIWSCKKWISTKSNLIFVLKQGACVAEFIKELAEFYKNAKKEKKTQTGRRLNLWYMKQTWFLPNSWSIDLNV